MEKMAVTDNPVIKFISAQPARSGNMHLFSAKQLLDKKTEIQNSD